MTPVDATDPAIDDVVAKWAATPGARGIRPVHPYIRSHGILPVAGRTPSFDWGSITGVRH